MLTVAKVTSSAATGYANYLEGRSQAPEAGDYYLSDGGERVEPPGRWVLRARGIEALGVDPSVAVGAGAFRAVMHVQHPTSGEMLRRVGGNGEAVFMPYAIAAKSAREKKAPHAIRLGQWRSVLN